MFKYFLLFLAGAICAYDTFKLESKETGNQEIEMIQHSAPEYLYLIVSQKQWQKNLLQKHDVFISSLDEDFIHLAKEDQLAHVAQKFWSHKDYVILKLSTKKLIGRLIYETNPGGSRHYYHLYEGKVPLAAVVDVTIVDN